MQKVTKPVPMTKTESIVVDCWNKVFRIHLKVKFTIWLILKKKQYFDDENVHSNSKMDKDVLLYTSTRKRENPNLSCQKRSKDFIFLTSNFFLHLKIVSLYFVMSNFFFFFLLSSKDHFSKYHTLQGENINSP